MKKIFLIFVFLSFNLFAQNTFPKLTGHVVDSANILSTDQKNNLENILKNHENNTSNQVVIVTIKTLNDKPIEEYALELGRYLEIGQKEKNNGVILLVSMQEHKIRIEVGYGHEGSLTDKISHEIIEYIIKPEFKKENYYNGILKGLNNIIDAIKNEYKFEKEDKKNESYIEYIFIFAFVFILLLEIISRFTKNKYLKKVSEPIIISLITYMVSSEVLQLHILLSSVITAFMFLYLIFKQTKNLNNDDLKEKSFANDEFYGFPNNYSTWGSTTGSFGGGFSGGGGSFGGGGASGGW